VTADSTSERRKVGAQVTTQDCIYRDLTQPRGVAILFSGLVLGRHARMESPAVFEVDGRPVSGDQLMQWDAVAAMFDAAEESLCSAASLDHAKALCASPGNATMAQLPDRMPVILEPAGRPPGWSRRPAILPPCCGRWRAAPAARHPGGEQRTERWGRAAGVERRPAHAPAKRRPGGGTQLERCRRQAHR